MTFSNRDLLACCSQLYEHPMFRWLLGNSMHPGGLVLTGKLARLLNLGPTTRVVDLGCGQGVTAVYLARTLGCRVVGVTPEASGVAAGRDMDWRQGETGLVEFVQGDWSQAPLREGSFDAIVAECVLSILPDKAAALRQCYALLGEGGRLGISDVIVNGSLPPELDHVLADAACFGGALALEQYRQMVEAAGFEVVSCQELPEVAAEFLREISGKLLMAEAAAGLGKLPLDLEVIWEAKRLVSVLREAVEHGLLSYGLVVAHREATQNGG